MTLTAAGVTAVALIFSIAFAALSNATPCRVWVLHSGTDDVGRRVAYQLKERIAHSALYSLATAQNEAALTLYLVSMDEGSVNGLASVFSVTITLASSTGLDKYLTSTVLVAGSEKVGWASDSIVSSLDETASKVRWACEPPPKSLPKHIRGDDGTMTRKPLQR